MWGNGKLHQGRQSQSRCLALNSPQFMSWRWRWLLNSSPAIQSVARRLLCCYWQEVPCCDTLRPEGKRTSKAHIGKTNKISLSNPGKSRIPKSQGRPQLSDQYQISSTFLSGRWHLPWKSPNLLSLKLTSCKPRCLGRVQVGARMEAKMTIPHLPINLRVGWGAIEEIPILELLSCGLPPLLLTAWKPLSST